MKMADMYGGFVTYPPARDDTSAVMCRGVPRCAAEGISTACRGDVHLIEILSCRIHCYLLVYRHVIWVPLTMSQTASR